MQQSGATAQSQRPVPQNDGSPKVIPLPKPRPGPANPFDVQPADREFLPAAIEILQSPASPLGSTLAMAICAMFLTALIWSYFGKLDIYAEAPGKIQPNGQSKVIQPLSSGKVIAIHVENGSRVSAGDVVIELDPAETAADEQSQRRIKEAAGAEAERRRAAIAVAQSKQLEPIPINFPADTSEAIKERETSVLAADIEQLRISVASLQAQVAEKLATKERLTMNIDTRKDLIKLGSERVEMRKQLDVKGVGSRAQTIEAMEQFQGYLVSDAGDHGQLLETDAAIHSLESKIEQAGTDFIATQAQKLADAERQRDKSEEDFIIARSKHQLTRLRAPISGTVEQLGVTSIGQVVSSGQSTMIIVPDEGTLEIQAMIANNDIGFVTPGQPAVVKVDAFPFGRYGTFEAVVSKVSHDAVDSRFSTNLSDAANAAKPQNSGAQPSQTPTLAYPAILTLKDTSITIDGKPTPFLPGMAVSVEIKTGQRRAIDYLLSPLRELQTKAAHER
jgi:hemolysin D